MEIQSLSIVVPTNNICLNNCKFCVSRTHTNPYEDRINRFAREYMKMEFFQKKIAEGYIEYKDYFNRLQFARDNGCNVVILTGTGEAMQNVNFLEFFAEINSKLDTPFKNIELQTTGVRLGLPGMDDLMEKNLKWLRGKIGVTTISFSISNLFDNDRNLELIGCSESLKFNVFNIIKIAKNVGFNIRLSLNLVNDYDKYSVEDVLKRCKELDADQVTFRKLYQSDENSDIDKWIEENHSMTFYDKLVEYVSTRKALGRLPFGAKVYNINHMSVCVDNDCMSEEVKDTFKYLILRENAKLYSRWETKSSLVF